MEVLTYLNGEPPWKGCFAKDKLEAGATSARDTGVPIYAHAQQGCTPLDSTLAAAIMFFFIAVGAKGKQNPSCLLGLKKHH